LGFFQINEEKAIKKEMEFELRREIEELSRTCSEQQQLIHHVSSLKKSKNHFFSFYGLLQ
jgi:prefoldin subunit 5